MKIAFVVNHIETEKAGYTTTHLALEATRMGHEAWYVNVADFCYDPDERIHARARRVRHPNHRLTRPYLDDLNSREAIQDYIDLFEFDVIMLRNDPAEDVISRPWAQLAGVNFARFAARHGVLVVNDPDGLTQALNKLYLQQFPSEVRPRVLISRDKARIKTFYREMGGSMVLKPLQGSGGRNVFLVRPEDQPNLNQMIEAVARDDYVIAQEFLPAAAEGDIRLFMLNGQPLQHKGHFAALQRVHSGADIRNNMTAGGRSTPAVITDEILQLAETIRPQLLHNGMFLVGLDIVGNKLMEINVFSPGGLQSAEAFSGVRFSRLIIEDLERKLSHRQESGRHLSNRELATL